MRRWLRIAVLATIGHFRIINEIYCTGMETVAFRPEIVRWWLSLEATAGRLGRVHRWLAAGHGPGGGRLHQHHSVTLVLCLAGAVRLSHPVGILDLAPGDSVLLEAGAWHHHGGLRPGTVAFGQGFMIGRSDWLLQSSDLVLSSSVAAEPSRQLLEELLALPSEAGRRIGLAAHLRGFCAEPSSPPASAHPAYPSMELALWDNLHHPDPVAAMVRASGLSRAQAYRVFAACAGIAPAAWVRRERHALARRLLGEGMTAAAVAARCGFPDRRALRRALN